MVVGFLLQDDREFDSDPRRELDCSLQELGVRDFGQFHVRSDRLEGRLHHRHGRTADPLSRFNYHPIVYRWGICVVSWRSMRSANTARCAGSGGVRPLGAYYYVVGIWCDLPRLQYGLGLLLSITKISEIPDGVDDGGILLLFGFDSVDMTMSLLPQIDNRRG